MLTVGAALSLAAQAFNPLQDILSEEEEEEQTVAHVEELTIELVKGPGGFGMDITDSGHVVGNTAGGVAEAAGARHPTRAVGQLTAAHGS